MVGRLPSDSYQGVHRLLGIAVSGESDHVLAISDGTQPAAFAGHVVSDRGRASEHGPAGVSLPGAASLGRWYNGNSRQIVSSHHGISDCRILCADVHREAVRLGEFQTLNVLSVEGVVSVGEAPLAFVGKGECHQGNSVNDALNVRQIARDVMAPQLPLGETADAGQQGIPVATTLTAGDRLPVNVLGTALSVATLDLQSTGIGAGLLAAGGCRDEANLAVGGASGEADLSGGHQVMAVDVAIIGGRGTIRCPIVPPSRLSHQPRTHWPLPGHKVLRSHRESLRHYNSHTHSQVDRRPSIPLNHYLILR